MVLLKVNNTKATVRHFNIDVYLNSKFIINFNEILYKINVMWKPLKFKELLKYFFGYAGPPFVLIVSSLPKVDYKINADY